MTCVLASYKLTGGSKLHSLLNMAIEAERCLGPTAFSH